MMPDPMTSESDNRRRRPRISTMILCEIRIGEMPPEIVRVRDLNETGIKIATRRILLLGDRLRVRLPGASDWSLARVAWRAEGLAGLSFSRAIDLPALAGGGISATLRATPPRAAHDRATG